MPDNLSANDLQRWLTSLGAKNPHASDKDIEFFTSAYRQDSRGYHDDSHRSEMGSGKLSHELRQQLPHDFMPVASALKAISGQGHDLAYLHVDGMVDPAQALHPTVKDKLGELIQVEARPEGFAVQLSEAGKSDRTTAIVYAAFGADRDGTVLHNKAGNELVSALATAKWMESKGVPEKHIAAMATTVAATFPFQSAGPSEAHPHPDGYMGTLAAQLEKTNETFGLELSAQEIDHCIHTAVDLANQDVSTFFKPDFAKVVHNGLLMRMEESPELRGNSPSHTVQDMLSAFEPGFYGLLKDPDFPIKPENISHHYKGYPDAATHQSRIDQIYTNIDRALAFNQAKTVGIGLVAAIAAAAGEPNTSAPELAVSKLWPADNAPQGELKAEPSDPILAALKNRGTGDAGKFDGEKSPISAFIYEKAGQEGIDRLHSQIDKKTFNNPADAKEYFASVAREIGAGNMRTILAELQVATLHNDDDRQMRGSEKRFSALDKLGNSDTLRQLDERERASAKPRPGRGV